MRFLNITELLKEKEYITIDMVGDSITCGTDHCSDEETYTAQFAKMIAEKFSSVSVNRYDGIPGEACGPIANFAGPFCVNKAAGTKHIDIIRNGVGGNTVRRAINRINDYTGILPNGKTADVTFFMFGINDALKSDSSKYVTSDKFYSDYTELLKLFKKTEASEIIIMSSTTNDQSIDEHVKMTEKIAEDNNLIYIDQNKVWNDHYDKSAPNFGHGSWLSGTPGDACHPSPEGAGEIAKEIMRHVI